MHNYGSRAGYSHMSHSRFSSKDFWARCTMAFLGSTYLSFFKRLMLPWKQQVRQQCENAIRKSSQSFSAVRSLLGCHPSHFHEGRHPNRFQALDWHWDAIPIVSMLDWHWKVTPTVFRRYIFIGRSSQSFSGVRLTLGDHPNGFQC